MVALLIAFGSMTVVLSGCDDTTVTVNSGGGSVEQPVVVTPVVPEPVEEDTGE